MGYAKCSDHRINMDQPFNKGVERCGKYSVPRRFVSGATICTMTSSAWQSLAHLGTASVHPRASDLPRMNSYELCYDSMTFPNMSKGFQNNSTSKITMIIQSFGKHVDEQIQQHKSRENIWTYTSQAFATLHCCASATSWAACAFAASATWRKTAAFCESTGTFDALVLDETSEDIWSCFQNEKKSSGLFPFESLRRRARALPSGAERTKWVSVCPKQIDTQHITAHPVNRYNTVYLECTDQSSHCQWNSNFAGMMPRF